MNAASSGGEPSPGAAVLRTLGVLELHGHGSGAAGLLARPKPLGLLLYLAISEAAFHPRESLLSLFWPDADGERARSSLRQAVYRLRLALGAGAVIGRGEEVGLAAGAVACDAAAFVRRAERGDAAGALGLYGGELLPGFFVEGAPAFDEWLDQQRRRLRGRAAAAAAAALDEAERADDLEAALGLARRAVALLPDEEPVARRLIALLGRRGDRAGALRSYEELAKRLRGRFGVGPSPATEELVARLRDPAATPVPAPPLGPRRVLVEAFENRTGLPEHDPFGRLVCDSVAQAATTLEGVEVVPLAPAVLPRPLEAADGPPAAHARAAAEAIGAATAITGSFYLMDGELVVHGWVTDVRTGLVVHGLGPVRAAAGRRNDAVEALRDEVRTTLALHLDNRVTHVRAAARAPTYAAHSAYVEGLGRFVEGDWTGALQHLDRAVAGHPEYVLPLLVSAIVRWNLSDLPRAEATVRRAAPLVRGAGPFEHALLDMIRAWLAGDWGAAYDAARRQTDLAPGSIPSFQVAQEARRRNRPREAVRILSSLHPQRGELRGLVYYWVELGQALHMLGDHEGELDAALRARALFPEHPLALGLEISARAALGDVDRVLARLDESAAGPSRQEPRAGPLMREAAHELLAHGHDARVADSLLQRAVGWHEDLPPEERALPSVARASARARYDAGDLEGAAAAFGGLAGDEIAVRDCGAPLHPHLCAHLDHGYLGVIAARRGDTAEASRIDALLERARGDHLFGSTHYWRAALAAARGDGESAGRLLRRAFACGMPFEAYIHRDPHFASLRGHPAFAALLAPKG